MTKSVNLIRQPTILAKLERSYLRDESIKKEFHKYLSVENLHQVGVHDDNSDNLLLTQMAGVDTYDEMFHTNDYSKYKDYFDGLYYNMT